MLRSIFCAVSISLSILLLLQTTHAATQKTVELNVNQETVEGRLQLEYPVRANTLNIAYDMIYKDDEYLAAGAEVLMGRAMYRDLEFFLGFRGLYGEVTGLPKDPNISSVGFSGKTQYTLFRDELAFPLIAAAQITVSPKPLSFGDTEQYWSFRTNLDFNILQNSGITVGYRYRDADLEKRGLNTSYSEDSVFIGYKLTF